MKNSDYIKSFDDVVGLAIYTVNKKYPDAELRCATGTSSKGSAISPEDIDQLEVKFANKGGTVTIKSTNWGEFAKPISSDLFPGDNFSIDWPISMNLPQAVKQLRSENYEQAIKSVELSHIDYPGAALAFTFYLLDGPVISINMSSDLLLQKGEQTNTSSSK